MQEKIYIRPLRETDAETSYKWRNDDAVWQYTENRPNKHITPETELNWIKDVLKCNNEKRFAICIKETDEYIGNVQLTDITGYDAQFHIFIGEKKYWNSGFGTAATSLIVDFAFNELTLQCVYLFVKKDNLPATKSYKKAGFYELIENDVTIRMAIYATDKRNKTISVFMMTYNHEKFIVEALEGIVNQIRNFDVEIVVGDDGSTDDTGKILMRYAKDHPFLFKLILHNENIGAVRNQLAVLNASKGKYVAMCEGDDYWTDPYKLQKQVNFLEANPGYAICFHAVNILDNDKERPSELNRSDKEQTYSILDLGDQNIMHTPSVVFRNGLIEKFPDWFSESPLGDYVLHFLNAKKGLIKYLPQTMAVYRMHNNGIWTSLQHRPLTLLERYIKALSLLISENFGEEVTKKLFFQKRQYVEEYLNLLIKEDNWDKFLKELELFSDSDTYIAKKWLLEYYPAYINSFRSHIKGLTSTRTFKFSKRLSKIYNSIKG